jgi:hypothetical protein
LHDGIHYYINENNVLLKFESNYWSPTVVSIIWKFLKYEILESNAKKTEELMFMRDNKMCNSSHIRQHSFIWFQSSILKVLQSSAWKKNKKMMNGKFLSFYLSQQFLFLLNFLTLQCSLGVVLAQQFTIYYLSLLTLKTFADIFISF